jgi:hypothetical protein
MPMSELLVELARDRWMAHQVLFERRHPEASAEGHERLVRDIYAPHPRRLIEGFRGLGKSTYLEEAALIRAGFGEFRYMVVVGASYSRACDRLAAVKREIEINDGFAAVFGKLKGSIWQEGKIVLANGCCLQALGREQSMLGMKYLDTRPDAALVDDVEDADEVRTDLERAQTWDWFLKTFLPSLAHPLFSWVRVLGTRRGAGSLPERLEKSGWPATRIPIEYQDEAGERRSSWPAKFPLPVIDEMKRAYRGDMHTFMQEYMCQPASAADRTFGAEMIRIEPRVPSWQAVYAMVDPARSTGRQSAATGWAVWSWLGPRLIVWAAGAEILKPDEIIDLCFRIALAYDPVWLGIEEDGLNEWLKQPLRIEMTRRHLVLPFRPMFAPRNKLAFIGGLQKFFAAGEVSFAQELPVLTEQLLSFPQGRNDALNALAYALMLRPAAPIYDDFGEDHVARGLSPLASRPLYLAASASRGTVAAALVQEWDGQLCVFADWLEDGAPPDVAGRIYTQAAQIGDTERLVQAPKGTHYAELLGAVPPAMELRRQPVRWIVPRWHKDKWQNVGLLQAIGRIPAAASVGGAETEGREDLKRRLQIRGGGMASVRVDERARWTLRALAGGYTRTVLKGGALSAEPEEGPYRLIMEALESFIAFGAPDSETADSQAHNFAVNKYGQRYESALPGR